MGFPERLVELRTRHGMTQKELAEKLGVSRGTIGMYEIGQRDPDTETIIKLTKIFNVSADYLMGLSDIPNPYKDTTNDSSSNADNEIKPDDNEEYFTISELIAFIKEKRKKKQGK